MCCKKRKFMSIICMCARNRQNLCLYLYVCKIYVYHMFVCKEKTKFASLVCVKKKIYICHLYVSEE